MTLKIDREEIWHWYQVFQAYHKQPLPPKPYCEAHGHEYKTFNNRYHRMIYKSIRHPELYNKLLPIARKYLNGSESVAQFVKTNDINRKFLSEMTTHLHYVDLIEELKAEKEQKPMQFIQVPSVQGAVARPPLEGEVMKQQNHVELIISAGVKVVVAPEVGADKLIRIIELLKDL